MAIYEYVCVDCCTEFELMRPMSESNKPAICPECKKPATRRVSSFGSKTGFYVKIPEKGPLRPALARQAVTKKKASAVVAKAPAKAAKAKSKTVAKKGAAAKKTRR